MNPSQTPTCPNCEIPVQPLRDRECPKCGEPILGRTPLGMLEVDVAHASETWDEAREKIMRALDQGLQNGHRGVKIIHGYGASTGMSVIREQAVRLMKSAALRNGGKLVQDRNNPGAHIPWLDGICRHHHSFQIMSSLFELLRCHVAAICYPERRKVGSRGHKDARPSRPARRS